MDAEHVHRHSTTATAGHGRWPARTQRLLGAIAPQCRQWLEPALQQCLEHFDRELYRLAERSRSHLEQQRCFDSRAVMQQQRAAFMQDCADKLRTGFARLGEPDDEVDAESTALQPLQLLDPREHELNSALDKLAARGEARHAPLLNELAYRFAVLVGAPPLEGAALPIAPAGLAQALRSAGATLDLPPEHQLLLLQAFEQTVVATAGSLYETVNSQLRNEGLLPQLRPYAPPRAAPVARTVPAVGEQPPDNATNTAAAAEPAGASPAPITVLETLRDLLAQRHAGTGGGGAAAGGRAASPDELQIALTAVQQHLAQVTDQASRELRSAQRLRDELLLQLNAGKPPGAVPTRLSAEQDDTVELVAMLFEQIGRQLHQGPHARSVLGDLQMPVLRLAVNDRGFFEQHEHPARRLLAAVAEAANDWLDGPDGDVDQQLTDRLQHLVARAQQEPPSAGLYTSLLADIEHHLAQLNRRAQAAERRHVEAMKGREKLDLARRRASDLLAERFATHPPRGLLRALLERAWADVLSLALLQHGENSPEFAQRLRVTDQLLGRRPVDDASLLQREVQEALQQIGMDAEEASQVAQRLIGRKVDEPAAAAQPPAPPAAAPVATKPTTTAPTAAGAAPRAAGNRAAPIPATSQRPAAQPAAPPPTPTAAKPVAATPAGNAAAAAKPAATTPVAAAPAAAAPVAAAPSVATPVVATPVAAPPAAATPHTAAPARELPSASELAQRLKQRQRLGESQQAKGKAPDADEAPLGPQEARIHNRLRQLPFGSWFEFTDTVTGETTRRKLAWFSPVSGNSLFVTRRGQRGYEMNLRELAQAMAKGQVRELPPQHDNLLDRAWQALTGNLSRPTPPPTPGARP